MGKTKDEWLVKDLIPKGDKVMDSAPEGGQKTSNMAAMAVCVAAGEPYLGLPVQQGRVLIIDEETPKRSIKKWLNRFAKGLGFKSYEDLPITLLSKTGFRLARKTELDRIRKIIEKEAPVLIRMESVAAMAPRGREGIGENDLGIGVAIKNDLDAILAMVPNAAIVLSAHMKKDKAEMSLNELRASEMVSLVRGHGSIVGQGCDTGLVIKKISQYPEPTRYAIITKPRRTAIPINELYVEIEEKKYGKGWARLKKIAPVLPMPSRLEIDLWHFLQDERTQRQIVQTFALESKPETKSALFSAIERKIIFPTKDFGYKAGTLSGTLPGIFDPKGKGKK